MQDEYKKLKCVFCGYEMASRAKDPRCNKCSSRRFNVIQDFTALKPWRDDTTMAKKPTETPKAEPIERAPQEKKPEIKAVERDDLDEFIFGDD
jgi:tRNA(Ile2) C34 agmatinyltransferase TiaS